MEESCKLQFLISLLTNLKREGHRTLVFSQSRKMLDIIEKVLKNQVRCVPQKYVEMENFYLIPTRVNFIKKIHKALPWQKS